MIRLFALVLALTFAAPAYADPPQKLVDANTWIVVNVLSPVTQAACRALTWKYAAHSYTGTPSTPTVNCATQ